MNFNDLQTTKLGTAAEDMLINEFVLSKGYIPYKPSISSSHPVDAIAMSGSTSWNLDIKAKSRMLYMDFTGIDIKDNEKYLTYENPTYILFADPHAGEVYGQWIQHLQNHPSKTFGDVIVWPLSAMTHYRYMTVKEQANLKSLENSNYR